MPKAREVLRVKAPIKVSKLLATLALYDEDLDESATLKHYAGSFIVEIPGDDDGDEAAD